MPAQAQAPVEKPAPPEERPPEMEDRIRPSPEKQAPQQNVFKQPPKSAPVEPPPPEKSDSPKMQMPALEPDANFDNMVKSQDIAR